MELFLKFIRIVLLLLLAVCYVKFVRDAMVLYIAIFGDALTDPERVVNVVFGVALTVIGLFGINFLLFKLNALALGILSSVFGFTFFYVIEPPGSSWELLTMITEYWHTTVNLMLIVASPTAVGWWMQSRSEREPPAAEVS
jgi:hypothetical protein